MNHRPSPPNPPRPQADAWPSHELLRTANAVLVEGFLRTGAPCLALLLARNYRRLFEDISIDRSHAARYGRLSQLWLNCYLALRFGSKTPPVTMDACAWDGDGDENERSVRRI